MQVHFLDGSGAVLDTQVIGEGLGNFQGTLDNIDHFGTSLTRVGDLNDDGTPDIAVGAPGDGFLGAGMVYILFLEPDGTVKEQTKIGLGIGGFDAWLNLFEGFGSSLGSAGDVDGDGNNDLFVGSNEERAWLLFLDSDGTVRSFLEYGVDDAGAAAGDEFAAALDSVQDLNGNATRELVVGAPHNPGGGWRRGGVYVLFHEGASTASKKLCGCNLNPADSISLSVPPAVGTTVKVAIDNPLGTQTPGATYPIYFVSAGDVLGSACGVLMPGTHMDLSVPNGELVALAPYVAISGLGAAWQGPGQPVELNMPIPQNTDLMGGTFILQGALLDLSGFATLTRGVELTVGS